MELSIIKPALVVALDIGSTYSGYAWQSRGAFETNRNDINFNINWGAGALQLHKTKSCILIEMKQDRKNTAKENENKSKFNIDFKDIEKVRIGHQAEDVYLNKAKTMKDGDLLGNYYLFSRFKLLLYKGFHDKQLVEDQIGQPLPLMDVMSLFIKELKDHCLNKLRKMRNKVDESETLFVVTVPAISSVKVKRFMRKAAEMAGIGKRNVLLALEPEAAAISCMHLPNQEREDMNNFDAKGQKFLVADLGGGTADLSALQVDKTGYIEELCEPVGSPVGGQNINDAFTQECFDSFDGDKWREIFEKSTPVEMLRMEADFEKKKVTIGTDDDEVVMVGVEIPHIVKTGLENETIRLKSGASVRYDSPEFQFNASFIREKLFKTTCKNIYDSTIKQVLGKPEASGISTVILVGGFVESQIVVDSLEQMITNDFPEVKVVVPYSPFKAVLQGAVLYGHDPMIFFSRISRETYGVGANTRFDEKQHDESKRWKNKETGNFYCKDIFFIHVKKGQSVRLTDKQPVHKYIPLFKEQKSMSFSINASNLLNPKYTTDEGCREIGKIIVEMPDTTGGTSREVEVTMIYGGTDLSVIATDKTTGKEFNTDIQFHTD